MIIAGIKCGGASNMKSLKEREWFFSQEREEFVSASPSLVYNPDDHYDIYKLKSTGQVISDVHLDLSLGLERPYIIGLTADLHFNYCNKADLQDEELSRTAACRMWPENLKWFTPAVKSVFSKFSSIS